MDTGDIEIRGVGLYLSLAISKPCQKLPCTFDVVHKIESGCLLHDVMQVSGDVETYSRKDGN